MHLKTNMSSLEGHCAAVGKDIFMVEQGIPQWDAIAAFK